MKRQKMLNTVFVELYQIEKHFKQKYLFLVCLPNTKHLQKSKDQLEFEIL